MFDSLTDLSETAATPVAAVSRDALNASRRSGIASLLGELRVRVAAGSACDRAGVIADALFAADQLMLVAAEALAHDDGVQAERGLPTKLFLQLEGRRMGGDAALLAKAARLFDSLPRLYEALSRGWISWSQARVIVFKLDQLPKRRGRQAVDTIISMHAEELADADPDRLLELIDEVIWRERQSFMASDEQRTIDSSFLSLQGRLDGSVRIYGEADGESGARLAATLDAFADRPANSSDPNAPRRSQQHFQALMRICDTATAGGTSGDGGVRPTILATIEIAAVASRMQVDAATRLDVQVDPASMRLLWSLAGRSVRLSPVAAEMLLCDATIRPIITRNGVPLAVGDEYQTFSPKVRAAIIARDGGCRFPGCQAPVAWADAHHISPGKGGSRATDGLLLCRKCHRRVHRYRWKILLEGDGTATFTRGRQRHTSYPLRAPPAAA